MPNEIFTNQEHLFSFRCEIHRKSEELPWLSQFDENNCSRRMMNGPVPIGEPEEIPAETPEINQGEQERPSAYP